VSILSQPPNRQLILQNKNKVDVTHGVMFRQIEQWANAQPPQCYQNWYNSSGWTWSIGSGSQTLGTFTVASAFVVRCLVNMQLAGASTATTVTLQMDGSNLSTGGVMYTTLRTTSPADLNTTVIGTTTISPGEHTFSVNYTVGTATAYPQKVYSEVQAVQVA
jgi:hypothetical protein